jgi:hypothetical protein
VLDVAQLNVGGLVSKSRPGMRCRDDNRITSAATVGCALEVGRSTPIGAAFSRDRQVLQLEVALVEAAASPRFRVGRGTRIEAAESRRGPVDEPAGFYELDHERRRCGCSVRNAVDVDCACAVDDDS